MVGTLSTLMNTVIGTIPAAVDGYFTKEANEKMAEREIKEYEYMIAQEKRAAQQAAAQTSKSVLNSELIKNVTLWTVTTIAGAVLARAVFKWAGF